MKKKKIGMGKRPRIKQMRKKNLTNKTWGREDLKNDRRGRMKN